MISLQTPLWLLLLGMIPLIRWLHRFRQQSRTFPSTTFFLWQRFQHQTDSDGAPGKPDPHWLLRAAIATLLVLSLAEPFVQSKHGHGIEIWLDDSLSMFTAEDERWRIKSAIAQLQTYLQENKPSRILVHSLGNPASTLLLDPKVSSHWAAQLAEWTQLPRGEPSPPPPATLSPDSGHILLTDGADSILNKWTTSAPLQHVIQVGNATQNIALTRLSLREPMDESNNLKGIARIDNLGDTQQTIRLILQLEERVIKTQLLELPAAGKTITTFTVPAAERGRLQARVESASDPLPLDDNLHLNLEKLHPLLRYEALGPCGPHFMAVLDSHPALIQNAEKPDLIINCSGRAHDGMQPTLWLHPAFSTRQTTQTAHWHSGVTMYSLRMAAGLPYSDAAPALSSSSTPILSADGRLLILKKPGSGHSIDSYLDTSDRLFSRHPEYPLLILGLIGQLTGRNLDITPLTASRDIEASRIRPEDLSATPISGIQNQPTQTSFTPLLLVASLLLLALDAALASGLVHGLGKQGA